MNEKLNKIFQNSPKINIDNNTKIVIMSDCHRGAGDNFDNFIKNRNIYEAALNYYNDKKFIYIELGDGDDMREVKNYEDIIDVHLNVFKKLKKFYDDNRFIMIYGNHDIVKKYPKILEQYFYKYYDNELKQEKKLLDDLKVYESLILDFYGYEIFLMHGHQVDYLNSTFWRFSKFLVKYVWKTLEYTGIKDLTSTAKNYKDINRVEEKLKKWSIINNKILISGHTHRAIFPKIGQSLYFNDGSCINPNGITAIEIENGYITLVRWELNTNDNGLLYAKRNVLAGKEPIIKFYKSNV